jgi:hypothetical protein
MIGGWKLANTLCKPTKGKDPYKDNLNFLSDTYDSKLGSALWYLVRMLWIQKVAAGGGSVGECQVERCNVGVLTRDLKRKGERIVKQERNLEYLKD